MTREQPRRPQWRAVVIVAGLAVVLLSACATVPHSGPVQPGQITGVPAGPGEEYAQLVAVPPQPGWGPGKIVQGFLAATASFADDHAAARKYLAPAGVLERPWHPGWAVTVVTSLKTAEIQYPNRPFPTVPQATAYATVAVTGEQQLASLNQTGQYVGTHRHTAPPVDFQLVKINNVWRIINPPNRLLLTETDFQGVYAQRNLYYQSGSGHALVPDPVYVPQQAPPAALARQLVTALLTNPQGWLQDGAQTAFLGASLLGVSIDAGTVTVNLGVRDTLASGEAQFGVMTSQLIWTLANGLPSVQAVRLEVNGKPAGSATWSGGQPEETGGLPVTVPGQRAGATLYSIAPGGTVQQIVNSVNQNSKYQRVPGEAGQGKVPLTTIAVSPNTVSSGTASPKYHWLAGLTASGRLYYGPLRPGAALNSWPHSTRFTSVSWDSDSNLWAAGPQGVWEISTDAPPVQVQLGPSLRGQQRIQQFRVALDGVRAAMIVSGPGGTRLEMGAIVSNSKGISVGQDGTPEPIGTDVTGSTNSVQQLTWYDAENLIVLVHSPTVGPELFEVPVDGGASTSLTTDIDTVSVSAAGPENKIIAGLTNRQVASTGMLNGEWTPIFGSGAAPTYPG